VDTLQAAVDVLATTPGRLDHARATVDLGAALRRANRRCEARKSLEHGMHEAHACGADALVAQAREELAACGARPRRPARTGWDALTPSERRIVQLARDGLGNREIAQSLFVTTKTVETHLGAAYRKLGITRRAQL
jgi:DNA-binding CsgD family transcriptional regulator